MQESFERSTKLNRCRCGDDRKLVQIAVVLVEMLVSRLNERVRLWGLQVQWSGWTSTATARYLSSSCGTTVVCVKLYYCGSYSSLDPITSQHPEPRVRTATHRDYERSIPLAWLNYSSSADRTRHLQLRYYTLLFPTRLRIRHVTQHEGRTFGAVGLQRGCMCQFSPVSRSAPTRRTLQPPGLESMGATVSRRNN